MQKILWAVVIALIIILLLLVAPIGLRKMAVGEIVDKTVVYAASEPNDVLVGQYFLQLLEEEGIKQDIQANMPGEMIVHRLSIHRGEREVRVLFNYQDRLQNPLVDESKVFHFNVQGVYTIR